MDHKMDEVAIYLFNEGKNAFAYRMMGCHRVEFHGQEQFRFLLWAPHAKSVSVVGDFNHWDTQKTPMQSLGSNGLFVAFVEEEILENHYKYYIVAQDDQSYYRADPYAFYSQLRPDSASIVYETDEFYWNDQNWMKEREQTPPYDRPVNIYEMHLGSWRNETRYREIAIPLAQYINDMGYTHIELMPLAEYPLDMSWGYQITGFFSPTARYGRPEDLKYMIDVLHQHGIGVILDWVPGHFPKDEQGLYHFDGQPCYEHPDTRISETEWGTVQFNYEKGEVISFLMSNAMYWLDVFHIDGLRVDAVSSMIYLNYCKNSKEKVKNAQGGEENTAAIAFFQKLSEQLFREFPNIIFSAEEATSYPLVTQPAYLNGLGFNYKWNMGFMHDILDYMAIDPLGRKFNHHLLTFSMYYAFSENYILPISHDEVVHGKKSLLDKMFGDYWQKFANMRTFYAYQFAHPGKKLTFMGCEIGQFIEWRYYEPLEWHLLSYDSHQQLKHCVSTINHIYRERTALYQIEKSWDGFSWLTVNDAENSVIAFVRYSLPGKPQQANIHLSFFSDIIEQFTGQEKTQMAEDPFVEIGKQIKQRIAEIFDQDLANMVVCIFNFTPIRRYNYRVAVPFAGHYRVILNTDANEFGGTGEDDLKNFHSQRVSCQGYQESISVTLPPLSALYLAFEPLNEKEKSDYIDMLYQNVVEQYTSAMLAYHK